MKRAVRHSREEAAIKEAASRLADALLADLRDGTMPYLDLVAVETAAEKLVKAAHLDRTIYRNMVNWTIRYVLERAIPGAGGVKH